MEWVRALDGSVVGLDTAPIIYLIEDNPVYLPVLQPFFEAFDRAEFRIVTSILTLTEVLVQPVRKGDNDLAAQYRNILLKVKGLTTSPVSQAIAERAANLRAQYNLRTPDAIQLATALQFGASFFVTNDEKFRNLPNVEVLVLSDLLRGSLGS